jgi:hypothetical protein
MRTEANPVFIEIGNVMIRRYQQGAFAEQLGKIPNFPLKSPLRIVVRG